MKRSHRYLFLTHALKLCFLFFCLLSFYGSTILAPESTTLLVLGTCIKEPFTDSFGCCIWLFFYWLIFDPHWFEMRCRFNVRVLKHNGCLASHELFLIDMIMVHLASLPFLSLKAFLIHIRVSFMRFIRWNWAFSICFIWFFCQIPEWHFINT